MCGVVERVLKTLPGLDVGGTALLRGGECWKGSWQRTKQGYHVLVGGRFAHGPICPEPRGRSKTQDYGDRDLRGNLTALPCMGIYFRWHSQEPAIYYLLGNLQGNLSVQFS